MPRLRLQFLTVLCTVLMLGALPVAWAQPGKSPFLGKSRDDVIAQLGEPKSNMRAGVRELLFFPHLKLTLRNNVVIEAEDLPDETPAPPAATQTAPPPAAAAAPAAPTVVPPVSEAPQPPRTTPAPEATPSAAPPPPKPADGTLAIKFIKSGSNAAKSTPRPASTTSATTTPSPAATKPAPVAEKKIADATPPPAELKPPTPPASESKDVAVVAPASTPLPATTSPVAASSEPAAVTEPTAVEEAPAKPAVDAKKKAAVRRRWRLRRDAESDDDTVDIFSTQSYVLAAIMIAGGAAFIWWRRGQKKLELAATAVSHSPFTTVVTSHAGDMFSADQIAKLGPKKFERLVASYYAKTGVVSERTNAGPDSPVHIKIFWKGEPKPFAGVQCHANPPTLIGPLPLMKLFEALAAADIRRGYVVTTGKFNVEARDLAEEKHFTLLPGDIFLEKLNALPPAARSELLKETNAPEEPAAAGAASV